MRCVAACSGFNRGALVIRTLAGREIGPVQTLEARVRVHRGFALHRKSVVPRHHIIPRGGLVLLTSCLLAGIPHARGHPASLGLPHRRDLQSGGNGRGAARRGIGGTLSFSFVHSFMRE